MDKHSPNLILHQRIVTSYRIPVYNKIIKSNNGLKVVYGEPKNHSSLKNGDVPSNRNYVKIKNFYLFKKREYFFANLFKIIIKERPQVIITQYSFSNLLIYALYLLRPFYNFKIVGWNHGWDRRKGFHPESSIKDKLRLYMLYQADAMIFYSEDAKQVLSKYTDKDKLFVANNTLDTQFQLALKAQFKKINKDKLNKEIGFNSKYNLIFIARLETPKNPKKLLNIFKELQTKLQDVSLHIVGSGPLETELKEIVLTKKIKNVKFYGAIYDDELTGKMLYCADLMIMPRWVGLSIIHAFCFECPMVTFEKDLHPPEIIYLQHGKTGYNFWDKSSVESIKQIIYYLHDKNLQDAFRKNINYIIENEANVSKMVEGVKSAVNFCLKL